MELIDNAMNNESIISPMPCLSEEQCVEQDTAVQVLPQCPALLQAKSRDTAQAEFEDWEKGQEIYKTENETFYKKGISINLKNRNSKKHKIISPKYKHELYL